MESTVLNTYETKRLTLLKSQLEAKKSEILDAQMELKQLADDLLPVGTDLDDNNPLVAQLRERKERLHNLETKLSTELEQINRKINDANSNLQHYKG